MNAYVIQFKKGMKIRRISGAVVSFGVSPGSVIRLALVQTEVVQMMKKPLPIKNVYSNGQMSSLLRFVKIEVGHGAACTIVVSLYGCHWPWNHYSPGEFW